MHTKDVIIAKVALSTLALEFVFIVILRQKEI